MPEVTIEWYLALSVLLFTIGTLGVLLRRNATSGKGLSFVNPLQTKKACDWLLIFPISRSSICKLHNS